VGLALFIGKLAPVEGLVIHGHGAQGLGDYVELFGAKVLAGEFGIDGAAVHVGWPSVRFGSVQLLCAYSYTTWGAYG
jgi:hypothetical protein